MAKVILQNLGPCFLERDHEQKIDKMSGHCSRRNIVGLTLILEPLFGNSCHTLNSSKVVNIPALERLHWVQKSLHLR